MKNLFDFAVFRKTSLLITVLLFCQIFTNNLQANVAQPGMWNAGGMGNFSLMFPQDSSAFGKIQMQEELVSILLYKGFAVVKGEYWMRNDTDSLIKIKTGYPINSSVENRGGKLMQAAFDELYGLKVSSDGKNIPLLQEEKMGNWYVWENIFPAGKTTKIEVYFLMNTNNASVLKGYTRSHRNGFVYLLETGAIWKQPIRKGEIRLQLKENLQLKNIIGVHPQNFFSQNKKEYILQGRFENLTPDSKNNIAIGYGKHLEDFDFEMIVNEQHKYFQEVNLLSERKLEQLDFLAVNFENAFEIGMFENGRPTGLFSWISLIFNIVIVLLGILIVRWIWRKVIRFFQL